MKHLTKIFFVTILIITFQEVFAQVGINTSVPLSTLDVNGNISIKTIGIPTALNGGSPGFATSINDGVYISLTPTSVGNDEFIMPTATSVPGRIYVLRNISNSINAKLYSFGGQFFHKGSNTATTAPLILSSNATGKSIIIISDGINWTYFD